MPMYYCFLGLLLTLQVCVQPRPQRMKVPWEAGYRRRNTRPGGNVSIQAQWRSQPDNLVLCKFSVIIIIRFLRNSLFSQSMNTKKFA